MLLSCNQSNLYRVRDVASLSLGRDILFNTIISSVSGDLNQIVCIRMLWPTNVWFKLYICQIVM